MAVLTMMALLLHILMWSVNFSAFAAQGEFFIFYILIHHLTWFHQALLFSLDFLTDFTGEKKKSSEELTPLSMLLENYLHFDK